MAKNVNRFSDLITESENKRSDIMEIINKLGYSSIEEIKKEKNILSKLEALLKELPGTQDVSEDEAEDIEDETKKKGEPKSLEDKEGEFEETSDSTSDGEVAEDAAEEIEDDTVKTGEPKELDDETEELQSDEEGVQEIPGNADDRTAGIEVPKKRILSFDEFVAGNPNPAEYPAPGGESDDLDEEDTTINKNVSYRDDDEEDEDYAEPVAASVKTDNSENVNEAKTDDKTAHNLVKKIIKSNSAFKWLNSDLPNNYTLTDVKKLLNDMGYGREYDRHINENKINNAKDFEDYAMEILKSAHGEDFDEEIATKVVNDLKSKYGEDWGAMVGALQSGMGK